MAEMTTTDENSSGHLPRWVWISFLVLTIAAYLCGLNIPFLGPDEPRYAQVAREMFERGDWITPTLGGFTWFEKPALLYWLEIVSYQLFGVSEFAARLGPAFFGLGTIVCLWILGRMSETTTGEFGLAQVREASREASFANWLALIAASTLGIYVFAHGASFDIIITFPMTAALVCFFVFDRKAQASRESGSSDASLPLILFYVFVGISLLAKGLIGMIFPFAIITFYFVLSWRIPNSKFILSLFWGTILTAAVASVWYLPVYFANGWPFVDEFFIQHHFQRFTSNKYQHPQPFYFFLWVLPLMILPWTPFVFASILKTARTSIRSFAGPHRPSLSHSPLLLFSISWLSIPIIFFSLSGSKLPGYILPSIPAAILLAAFSVYGLVLKSRTWAISVVATALGVLLVSMILFFTLVPKFADHDSVKGLLQAAAERGHSTDRIFGLHAISHSAEFYAAGRLLREADGKQKKLYSPAEVAAEMQRAEVKRALVLVPIEYLDQITYNRVLKSEILRDNTELAIVAVSIE